jgi:hypothetical protein
MASSPFSFPNVIGGVPSGCVASQGALLKVPPASHALLTQGATHVDKSLFSNWHNGAAMIWLTFGIRFICLFPS